MRGHVDIGGLVRGPLSVESPRDRRDRAHGNAEPVAVYFMNSWLDAAMIGGFSIALFVLLRLFYGGDSNATGIKLAAILSVFVNYPHFSATIYRLYQNSGNVREFPVTALGLPFVMAGAIAAAIWQPVVVAPYFFLLYLFWSSYHYSGQTLGITMIYARRSGFAIGSWERLALSGFVLSTFVLSFAQRQNGAAISFYGTVLPRFHFPDWFVAGLTVVIVGSAVAFGVLVIRAYRARGVVLRPIVVLPAITQFVWFLPGAQTPAFYEFVPLFHSLQYLYIAWVMQLGQRQDRPEAEPSPSSVVYETLRWLGANCAGGIVLFFGLPWLLFWVNLPMLTVAGIVIAAINIHHFFVDGVIWKLRDAPRRSPLLMSVAQFAMPLAARP